MPTTPGTGNAKNVANFESLISFCNGYGTTYNPTREVLKVAALQTLLAAANTSLKDCKTTETALDNAVDERKDLFINLKSLSTRVVNALAIAGVADSIIEGARTINRKLQGQKAVSTIAAAATAAKKALIAAGTSGTATIDEPKAVSSAQQGFDNLIEHFNGLIELVSSHPEYNPNEKELQVAGLQSYLAALRQANTAVKTATTNWSNSRINRDTLMYAHNTGMVDIAIDVKGYIKSVFGASSPQFMQVNGIAFKNIVG